MKYFVQSILLFLSLTATAQSPVDIWKTIDEDSGDARSYVEIYEQGGMLYGKITKLLDQAPNAISDLCTDKKKNTPFV